MIKVFQKHAEELELIVINTIKRFLSLELDKNPWNYIEKSTEFFCSLLSIEKFRFYSRNGVSQGFQKLPWVPFTPSNSELPNTAGKYSYAVKKSFLSMIK